jgi:isopenicillin N synthase-like dioxygenase
MGNSQDSPRYGFFYIKNHGVPQAMVDGQLELARTFFALPMDEKLAVDASLSTCTRGYETMGLQTLDDGSPPDLKEGFLIGCDLDENHPYVRDGVPNCGATFGHRSQRVSAHL